MSLHGQSLVNANGAATQVGSGIEFDEPLTNVALYWTLTVTSQGVGGWQLALEGNIGGAWFVLGAFGESGLPLPGGPYVGVIRNTAASGAPVVGIRANLIEVPISASVVLNAYVVASKTSEQ